MVRTLPMATEQIFQNVQLVDVRWVNTKIGLPVVSATIPFRKANKILFFFEGDHMKGECCLCIETKEGHWLKSKIATTGLIMFFCNDCIAQMPHSLGPQICDIIDKQCRICLKAVETDEQNVCESCLRQRDFTISMSIDELTTYIDYLAEGIEETKSAIEHEDIPTVKTWFENYLKVQQTLKDKFEKPYNELKEQGEVP